MEVSTPFHFLILLDPHLIIQMSSNDYICLILILAGIMLGCFLYTFSLVRRARWIMDTPTSKISSAAQGFVELEGKQKNIEGQPVYSPISNTLCTWYDYSIEKKVRQGKKTHWRTIASGTSQALFGMTDATGECTIDPDQATILGGYTQVWYGLSPKGCEYSRLRAWLIFFPYCYTEHLFKPNDPLYAMGMFHSDESQVHTLSAKDKADRPFILSTTPQATLIRKAKYNAFLLFILTLAVGAAILDLLNFRPL